MFQCRIPIELDGARLQDALPELVTAWIPSRKGCKKAIERRRVLLNGHVAETARRVRTGDALTLLEPARGVISSPNTTRVVLIAIEDDALLVAWKPPGMSTSGNRARTFRQSIAAQALPSTAQDAFFQPEPMHRLDFMTSGWVICAKTHSAAAAMGRQFENGTVHKKYRACVHGHVPQSMNVALPIAGQAAQSRAHLITHGFLLGREPVSFVSIELLTGRTHQIRKHLAAIGHGVLGDDRHGIPKAGRYHGHGLFLCAAHVSFRHPVSDQALHFEGELPRKFQRLRGIDTTLPRAKEQTLS